MNKKILCITLLAVLGLLNAPTRAQENGNLQSLRGGNTVDDISLGATIKPWQRDRDPIARDYVSQPPLVPHSIEGYQINHKSNKCLTCHSWANYKKSGATKISQTHFQDRQRSLRANVAGTRYFCTQCHVPQRDVEPLVDNTFLPVETLRQQ